MRSTHSKLILYIFLASVSNSTAIFIECDRVLLQTSNQSLAVSAKQYLAVTIRMFLSAPERQQNHP